jgi:hypothetical protein
MIEGSTVHHLIDWWDRRADRATSVCGVVGTPVEVDPDEVDTCDLCEQRR